MISPLAESTKNVAYALASPNKAMPVCKKRLRPQRSPSDPAVNKSPAKTSE